MCDADEEFLNGIRRQNAISTVVILCLWPTIPVDAWPV